MRKARTEGLAATVQSVRGRLAEDMPLGYSAAGEVVDVGLAVSDIQVGQLVATGGAGDPHPGAAQAHRPLGRPGPGSPSQPGATKAECAVESSHFRRLRAYNVSRQPVAIGRLANPGSFSGK